MDVPVPVTIEDCKLDLAGHTFVDGSGREVRLTRAETALMTAFVDSPRRVLSRDHLRFAVAGRGAEPYDRKHRYARRPSARKIEPDPKAPRFILSVPGVGYKFDVRRRAPRMASFRQLLRRNSSTGSAVERPSRQACRAGKCRTTFRATKAAVDVLACRLVGSTALAVNLDPEDFGDSHRRFQEIARSRQSPPDPD